MGKLITGTHHTAIRCCGEEQYKEAVSFYTDVLGLDIIRTWGEGTGSGIMLNTGSGIIEMFADAEPGKTTGIIEHIALETDDVDACIEAVRAVGCTIKDEPHDIVISSVPGYPARIAFCYGKAGEMIEFFKPL